MSYTMAGAMGDRAFQDIAARHLMCGGPMAGPKTQVAMAAGPTPFHSEQGS